MISTVAMLLYHPKSDKQNAQPDCPRPYETQQHKCGTGIFRTFCQDMVIFGYKVDYAFNLTQATPSKKSGNPEDEKRLYMSWQKTGGQMAAFDRQLISAAGIKTERRLILQFYPKQTEIMLYSLEVQAARDAGHTDPREFLKTIFGVRTARRGYEFYVIDQFFRPAPTS